MKTANAKKTVSVATAAETTPEAVGHTSTSTFTQSGIELAMHAEASYPDVLVADALYPAAEFTQSSRLKRGIPWVGPCRLVGSPYPTMQCVQLTAGVPRMDSNSK